MAVGRRPQSLSAGGRDAKHPHDMAAKSPVWRIWERASKVWEDLVSEVRHHHCHHILFIRSESLSPANAQGEKKLSSPFSKGRASRNVWVLLFKAITFSKAKYFRLYRLLSLGSANSTPLDWPVFLYGMWALLEQAGPVRHGGQLENPLPPCPPISVPACLACSILLLPEAHAVCHLRVGNSTVGNCWAPSRGISAQELVTW